MAACWSVALLGVRAHAPPTNFAASKKIEAPRSLATEFSVPSIACPTRRAGLPGLQSSYPAASAALSLSILAVCMVRTGSKHHGLNRRGVRSRLSSAVACYAEANESKDGESKDQEVDSATEEEEEPEAQEGAGQGKRKRRRKKPEATEEEEEEEDEEDREDKVAEDEAKEKKYEKPKKWKCLDCGNTNFAVSTECDKCGSAKPSPEEAKLVEEKGQAKEEVNKVMDNFLRLQADLQNYRRDHTEAMSRAQANGKQDALKKLLPINEDIEAALIEPEGMDEKDKAIFTSYSILFRKVSDVWTKGGVESFVAEVGEKLDRVRHTVVEEREAEGEEEPGTVLEVLKSGWKCDGRTVLPSQVVIAASPHTALEEMKGQAATPKGAAEDDMPDESDA